MRPSLADWAIGLGLLTRIAAFGGLTALQNDSQRESDTDSRHEAVVPKVTRLDSLLQQSSKGWRLLWEDPTEVEAVSD